LGAGKAGLWTHPSTALGALGFALLAVLRVILELFVVKEDLFASGKDKLRATIDARHHSIRKIHGHVPEAGGHAGAGLTTEKLAVPVSLSSNKYQQKGARAAQKGCGNYRQRGREIIQSPRQTPRRIREDATGRSSQMLF
jgi:hypothetical protein